VRVLLSGNYRFLLRGPAPRGYNGDGECMVGTAGGS
jgi:hypothetical protein